MQSMEEIYQKYAKTVYRYLVSQTHNDDVAEELTQETFYQAIKSIERYDGSCKITTWLCAIAKNQWLAYQRKHPIVEEVEEYDASTSSAEAEAISALSQMELLKRLHECPEPLREITEKNSCNLDFSVI